jgi:hypothetical protein
MNAKKTRRDQDQFQLIPEEMMPFNTSAEILPITEPPHDEPEDGPEPQDNQIWIVDFTNYSNE